MINGGTSFSRWNASGITHGTSGNWRQHAAQHEIGRGKSEGRPVLPQTLQLPPGQLDLHHQYVNSEGGRKQGIRQGDYTVVDAEGGVHQGTLDDDGFASVAGLPMGMATVSYGKDPRDPWDEDSDLGQGSEWPTVALDVGPDARATAAGSLSGTVGKFGPIAQAAGQAASAVQSLHIGGARALLGPVAPAALANVADKLPGGATALDIYGALSVGKPVAAAASPVGFPGSLTRIDGEVPHPLPKNPSFKNLS